jgi:hypothetical protein
MDSFKEWIKKTDEATTSTGAGTTGTDDVAMFARPIMGPVRRIKKDKDGKNLPNLPFIQQS